MENYQPKRLSQNRRPWEFKKKLAAWAAVAITAAAVASYALAYMDKQTASDVTIAIITACGSVIAAYIAASTGEKVSRNRHGLDADGLPYQAANTDAAVDTSTAASCSDTTTTGKG